MSRSRWHILSEAGAVTVCRRIPPRFDVVAEARLPAPRRPLRLAQQVRQDMWRLLRDLRGFLPVVRVADAPDGLVILRAGGEVAAGSFPGHGVEARIAALLGSRSHRERWLRHAGGVRD